MDTSSIIWFFTSIIFLQSCSDCDPKPVNYPQDMVFAIYPEKRTYRVGDTLNFFTYTQENIFPTGFDMNSDEIISQISVYQHHNYFTDSAYTSRPAQKFESYILKGKKVNVPDNLFDKVILGFDYVFVDSNYLTEIDIIPKDTGIYSFTPGGGVIKTNIGERRCEQNGSFDIFYHNYNTNWSLYDSINKVNSIPTPEARKTHYIFEVIPK